MDKLKNFENFFEIIKKFNKSLQFKIVEIGAHPYGEFKEVTHTLLDYFPGSEIYAFEVDKKECEKLNKICKKGMKFFPIAFEDSCQLPASSTNPDSITNRLYFYGVIARLATLAAAREMQK